MSDTKTILVADDETDIREALTTILAAEGFTVIATTDGPTTLAKIRSEKPDLALLDIQMPGLSGTEVLAELRADEEYADLPVMMLTAQSDMDHISEALESGGVNFEYLTKTDWKLAEVVEKVKSRLER